MPSQYVYESLDPQTESFRLLQLLPGQDDDVIECVLSVHTLSAEDDKYTALSYTWGEKQPAQMIKVNARQHSIRPNLCSFLRTYRDPVKPLTLWIDALCIDQSCVKERNHQVSIMTKIYKSAFEVTAWLGPESPASIQIFRPLCEKPLPRGWSASMSLRDRMEWVLKLPFWRRIWIVQGLMFAKKVLLMLGNNSIKWTRFRALANYAFNLTHGRFDFADELHLRVLKGIDAQRMRRERLLREPTKKQNDLHDVLHFFSELECSLLHDHIYAVLGMTEERTDITVDYDLDPAVIFVQTAIASSLLESMPVMSLCQNIWLFRVIRKRLYQEMYHTRLYSP